MKKICFVVIGCFMQVAWSATITVDSSEFNNSNNGNCNFAEAVLSAGFDLAFDQCAMGSGDDVIQFELSLFPAPLNTLILSADDTLILFGDSIDIQVPAGKTLTLLSDGNQAFFDVNLDPNSSFSLNRTILRDASSSGNGGAIQFDEDVDDIYLTEVSFINNHSDGFGGAIGFDRAQNATNITTIHLIDSEFIGNSAENGGAIFADKFIRLNINGTVFNNNTAADFGGALRVFDDINVEQSVFTANQAQYGGGIYSTGGVVDVQNSLFENNLVSANGGALFKTNEVTITTTELRFRRNSVLNNQAASGAGVFVEYNHLYFNNNLVANNVASVGVGGLRNNLSSSTDGAHQINIIGNTFYHNISQGGGAGVADVYSYFSNNVTTYKGNALVSEASNNTVTKCQFFRVNNHVSKHNLSNLDSGCLIGNDNQILADPVVAYESQTGFHPYRLVPKVTSPLIDAWERNDCYDGDGLLLDFDLTGRRNHSGLLNFYNGDGDDQGHCDIGSAEVPDASLVGIGRVGNGVGRIYGNPETALDCTGPIVCEQAITIGEEITLNTQAYFGSRFVQWGLDGAVCGMAETCVLTVPNHLITVSAEFELIPTYQLTVEKQGNGLGRIYAIQTQAIDCGESCSAHIQENTVITLEVDVNNGHQFVEWSGDCTGSGSCDLVMDSEKTVTATFINLDVIFDNGFEEL
ncbi:MAG: hypothetical protein KDI92_02100 [Xanthomonadales bacterium]|nr:hypothetical protein [Xanthomonadales bacterium]